MKIVKMTLENFKGIRHAEFDLDGRNANIFGANGTGKTTVYDAFTWLLFGKSSEERANFSPKTITPDGPAHNLEHSVECTIDMGDEVVTFKRVYHEVYKKTRGNPTAELSGHTTDYYINGVPKKEKEYQRYWEDIFPNEKLVKLLTIPNYFAEILPKDERRDILMDVCGDISDEEIIAGTPELAELSGMLGTNSVDEYKKIAKSKKAEINKKIELIPARIDEATKAIPNTEGLDGLEITGQLATVREKISAGEKEKAAVLAGGEDSAKIRVKLSELECELAQARKNYVDRQNSADYQAMGKEKILRGRLADAERDLDENKKELAKCRSKASEIEKKREDIFAEHRKLQEEYNALQAEKFDEQSTVCDKCGRALPEDKAAELRENFNLRKSEKLSALKAKMDELIERGKAECSKEMLADAQMKIAENSELVERGEIELAGLRKKLDDAVSEAQMNALPPFEDTEEYAKITAKIAEIKSAEKSAEPDVSGIEADIAEFRRMETILTGKLAALDTEKAQRQRITELEDEEKNLGTEYEKAERALWLCEEFTRVKSKKLSEKINEKFRTVRFQLFQQNITNDGLADVCNVLVPTVDGSFVPFSDANKAARLNAGIEIISVLGEHYGIELPIFVDNAESVTKIVPTKGQLIRLIVSEPDTSLRLELV